MDPRLKILYVLVVGVAAFATSNPWILVSLLAIQLGLWLAARIPPSDLFGSLRRISVFVAFIVLSFVFFGPEKGARIWRWSLGGLEIPINLSGLALGLLRSSRIITVILSAQIVQRTGEPGSMIQGLRGLGAPPFLAYGLDLVLSALGPRGGRGRRGKGERTNRQRKGEEGEDHRKEDGVQLRRLLRGDVEPIVRMMQEQIGRAREQAVRYGLEPDAANDLAVVVGFAVLAMTLRFLQVLPGLPVAPGHKGLLLIPLFILASTLTNSRWGGTQLGLILGLTGFLFGMGKFGPFDILRHMSPGIFVDLTLPPLKRLVREPGPLVYGLVGVGAAGARISTLVAVAAFAGAPPAFYALIVPSLVSSILFGVLSGFVTHHLMRYLSSLKGVLEIGAGEQGSQDEDDRET